MLYFINLVTTFMKLQVSFPVIFTLARMRQAVGMGLLLVSAFWFYKIAKVVKYEVITKSTFKTC
ncbi:hypothetical protein Hanom_Chr09g00843991 [Helianthus anomalus]